MLVFYINLSFSLYCLQPFVPENAHVIFNEPGPYVPDTVAKYSCALGFERIGQEKRTCLSNGTWSGSAPVCALDIAVNKPVEQSSGGPPSASRGFCYITNNDTKSWWEVELLGSYSIHSIVMQSGKQSSNLVSIELMLDTGDLKSCDISSHSLSDSNIISVICSYDHVSKVRIITANRLELCAVHVYATNAGLIIYIKNMFGFTIVFCFLLGVVYRSLAYSTDYRRVKRSFFARRPVNGEIT
uniref:Sushi domain-containing protein n=1 Tax=Heterorhabditis bacteriophora TaxID=37862 RepID=A0A1I7XRQ1_HETBA